MEPLTIRELIDKLNLIVERNFVSETDYVFFIPVGEDEGDALALTPIHNVAAPSIKFSVNDSDIDIIKNKRGIDLCFVKQDIQSIRDKKLKKLI